MTQDIMCGVNDCKFNDAGCKCGLESIQVGCCSDCGAECSEDSMCCSFRKK